MAWGSWDSSWGETENVPSSPDELRNVGLLCVEDCGGKSLGVPLGNVTRDLWAQQSEQRVSLSQIWRGHSRDCSQGSLQEQRASCHRTWGNLCFLPGLLTGGLGFVCSSPRNSGICVPQEVRVSLGAGSTDRSGVLTESGFNSHGRSDLNMFLRVAAGRLDSVEL